MILRDRCKTREEKCIYPFYPQVLRKVNKCEVTELFGQSSRSTCEMNGHSQRSAQHLAELPHNDLRYGPQIEMLHLVDD